ncbi:MAG: hypothetical protein Q9M89_05915 [Persephonella sp.]|nr:hypothetical protein [Persephonella sp.]
MEYNLVHAMLGRFGVLIPLLGLFFELGAAITGKKEVSKISGSIVLSGYVIVILAGITGFEEIKYLQSVNVFTDRYSLHIILGSIIIFLFTIISFIRIYLFKNVVEKLVITYFVLYVVMVFLNLISNEFVIRAVWGR